MERHPLKVLLVEDNPGDARLVQEMLAQASTREAASAFELTCVERLDRAQDHLKQDGFDVVLLDLALPDSQGLDTLQRMLEVTTELPVVVMSGLDDGRLALEAVKAGAQDYLVKGRVDEYVLPRTIHHAIQRKRSEQALRESQERFKSLFENVAIGLYRTRPDGRILMVNPALVKMLGYGSFRDLADRNLEESGFQPDYPRAAFKERIEREGQIIGLESAWTRKDGTTLFLRESARAVRDAGGEILYYEGTVEDITQRVRAEGRIEHLNAVLRAIRNVNQLLIKEKDLDRLLQGVCDSLIETRGYFNAWIALLDPDGEVEAAAAAGLNPASLAKVRSSGPESWSECSREALAHPDIVSVQATCSPCDGCPLVEAHRGRGVMVTCLRHGEKIYGLLTISTVRELVDDAEEQNLFRQVAGDIAFALHSLEAEAERRRAERALAESAQKLKEAQAVGRLGSWEFDVATQEIHWSDQVYEVYGRDPALGPPTLEEEAVYYTPEEHQRLKEYARRAIAEGKAFAYDLQARLPGGKTVHLAAKMRPEKDERGQVTKLFGTVQDITERKLAEEALRQYTERLRNLRAIDGAILAAWSPREVARTALRRIRRLVPSLGGGIVLYDPTAEEAELFAVEADGESGDQFKLGTRFSVRDLNLVETLRQGKVLVERDVAAGPSSSPVTQILIASGTRSYVAVPLITRGELIGALALGADDPEAFAHQDVDIVREVADQVAVALQQARLREALEAEQRRLETLINHLPEGVLLLDERHHILLANSTAEAYLPLLTQASSGARLTHLAERPLEALLAPPPEGLWHELAIPGPPPQEFEVVAKSIGEGVAPGGWVLLLRDVTQEREMQQRIHHHERLAAVGQLAAGIAHDFNNIMASIVLYAGMLLRSDDLSPNMRKRLEVISQQGHRAAKLVQQILDFSRQSVIERHPLDLVPFLKELEKLLVRTLPENIDLQLAHEQHEYVVEADPTRIQQAVMNLALNARDAMPKGGELRFQLSRIRTKPDQSPPLPDMPTDVEAWVRLAVTDTGGGIRPEVLPHIFEPFFTTKERGKGTGLGLAQVYGIVGQHGGFIDVKSQPGQGTTFIVYLPAWTVTDEVPAAPSEQVATSRHGETILVVEDDPMTRAALAEVLESVGYRVRTAADGQEALARFDEGIDLVLSDLVMPRLGGPELYAQLKEKHPQVKMVVISGYPMEDDGKALLEEGILSRIEKPFSAEEVTRAVQEALAH